MLWVLADTVTARVSLQRESQGRIRKELVRYLFQHQHQHQHQHQPHRPRGPGPGAPYYYMSKRLPNKKPGFEISLMYKMHLHFWSKSRKSVLLNQKPQDKDKTPARRNGFIKSSDHIPRPPQSFYPMSPGASCPVLVSVLSFRSQPERQTLPLLLCFALLCAVHWRVEPPRLLSLKGRYLSPPCIEVHFRMTS